MRQSWLGRAGRAERVASARVQPWRGPGVSRHRGGLRGCSGGARGPSGQEAEPQAPVGSGAEFGIYSARGEATGGLSQENRRGGFWEQGHGVASGEADVGETARRFLNGRVSHGTGDLAREIERSGRIQEGSGDGGARTC